MNGPWSPTPSRIGSAHKECTDLEKKLALANAMKSVYRNPIQLYERVTENDYKSLRQPAMITRYRYGEP